MPRSESLAIGIVIIAVGAAQLAEHRHDEALPSASGCPSPPSSGLEEDWVSILQTSKQLSKVLFNHSSMDKLSTLQVPGVPPGNSLLPDRLWQLLGLIIPAIEGWGYGMPQVTGMRRWSYSDKCNTAVYGVDYLCVVLAPLNYLRAKIADFGKYIDDHRLKWVLALLYCVFIMLVLVCIAKGCIPSHDTQDQVRITAKMLKPTEAQFGPRFLGGGKDAVPGADKRPRVMFGTGKAAIPGAGSYPSPEVGRFFAEKSTPLSTPLSAPSKAPMSATPISTSLLSAALYPESEPVVVKFGVPEGLSPLASYARRGDDL